jgi:hypothetical protein
VPLKTEAQIEDAVKYFTDIIEWAGWTATPETTCTTSSYDCPIFIKQKQQNSLGSLTSHNPIGLQGLITGIALLFYFNNNNNNNNNNTGASSE